MTNVDDWEGTHDEWRQFNEMLKQQESAATNSKRAFLRATFGQLMNPLWNGLSLAFALCLLVTSAPVVYLFGMWGFVVWAIWYVAIGSLFNVLMNLWDRVDKLEAELKTLRKS